VTEHRHRFRPTLGVGFEPVSLPLDEAPAGSASGILHEGLPRDWKVKV